MGQENKHRRLHHACLSSPTPLPFHTITISSSDMEGAEATEQSSNIVKKKRRRHNGTFGKAKKKNGMGENSG